MALYQVSAGDRILAADINQFYSILKGVAASGEGITLLYNAAGVLKMQPSSDPAAGTEMLQILNNAGTRQISLTSDGKLKFADATTQSSAASAITTTTDTLGTDVTITPAQTWVDVLSRASVLAGTYLVQAQAVITATTSTYYAIGLYDATGAAHLAITESLILSSSDMSLNLSVIVTLGSTSTLKLRVITNSGTTSTVSRAATTVSNGAGNIATKLHVIKIA